MDAVAKKVGVETEVRTSRVSKVLVNGAMGVSFVGLGLFGLWVLGCIVGGMIEAGGPFAFVHSWFSAVTGG